jgi:hypothetical protein
VSSLAAVSFASAFTLAPSPAGSSLAASPGHARSNTYTAASFKKSAAAAHAWHLLHIAHLRHLKYLAWQAAQARWAADHPVQHARTYSAPSHPDYAPPVQHHSAAQAVTVPVSGSGMQACIIARESGGNPNVMNASGHYGLYQFSYSTWVASGGNGADFGHASVAEQNRVFANAVAARGYSDWTPYDGC